MTTGKYEENLVFPGEILKFSLRHSAIRLNFRTYQKISHTTWSLLDQSEAGIFNWDVIKWIMEENVIVFKWINSFLNEHNYMNFCRNYRHLLNIILLSPSAEYYFTIAICWILFYYRHLLNIILLSPSAEYYFTIAICWILFVTDRSPISRIFETLLLLLLSD